MQTVPSLGIAIPKWVRKLKGMPPSDLKGQDLIYLFCYTVEEDEAPNKELLVELGNRLLKSVGPNAIPAGQALRIERRGRKSKRAYHVELAMAVIHESSKKTKNAKGAVTKAIGEVASKKGISEDVVRHAYDAHRKHALVLLHLKKVRLG